jgi:hypothetical protein
MVVRGEGESGSGYEGEAKGVELTGAFAAFFCCLPKVASDEKRVMQMMLAGGNDDDTVPSMGGESSGGASSVKREQKAAAEEAQADKGKPGKPKLSRAGEMALMLAARPLKREMQ